MTPFTEDFVTNVRDANSRFLLWNPNVDAWSKYVPKPEERSSTFETAPLSHYQPEAQRQAFWLQQRKQMHPVLSHFNTTKIFENLDAVGGRFIVCREIKNTVVSPVVYIDIMPDYEIRVGLQVCTGWNSHDMAICSHPSVGFRLFLALVVSVTDEYGYDVSGVYDRFLASLEPWVIPFSS